MAIFKETKRPSKEMQATIAEQLGLKVSTVANFFMNARRRSLDKYTDANDVVQAACNDTIAAEAAEQQQQHHHSAGPVHQN